VSWLQAKQALRGVRGVALSIPDSGSRGVGNIMPLLNYPQERNSIPIVQKVGWTLGLVRIGSQNLACTGVRSGATQPIAIHYTVKVTPPQNPDNSTKTGPSSDGHKYIFKSLEISYLLVFWLMLKPSSGCLQELKVLCTAVYH
jgi:hypothetical protein